MTSLRESDPITNGRIKIDPRLLISIVGWIVSIAVAWGLMGGRISVLESKQSDADRRIERIEGKIDILIERAH